MIMDVTRRGSSPHFVGRRPELDRLDEAFKRASVGQPTLVLVAGEAGVGKSRLTAEFISGIESSGGWAAAGGCLDLGEGGLPYAPFAEALRALVGRIDPVDRAAVFGPSADALARLVPDLRRPGRVVDIDDPTEPAGRLARLFDSVIDALGRLSRERPLTIILEDIHWADGSTRDLIRFLVRNLRAERLLLVATYRSDDIHRRHPLMPLLSELDRADRVERVELRRFDRDELAEQLAGILGEQPSASLTEVLLERSDGIPFYVEELVTRGGHGDRVLPTSLHDILDQRLAVLSGKPLELVRAAAVIGGRSTHERLAAVAGIDDEAMVAALREAIDAGVLIPVDDVGGPSYTFRHALLREAAYDDLLPAERVRIHRRLADHLESLLDAASTNDPSVIADFALHAYHAHDQLRGLVGAVRAVEALNAAAAFREALSHAERALELWPRVDRAAEIAGMGHADLLVRAALVAANAGDPARALALDQSAMLEMDPDLDNERLTALLMDLWEVAWEAGAFDVAVAASHRVLDMVEQRPASSLKARALAIAGSDRWTAGRIRDSVTLYRESMAVAEAIGDKRAWAIAASPLAHSLAGLGRAGRAEVLVDEARATSVPFDGTPWSFWIAVDQAMALWYAGRFEDSLRTNEIALEAATRYGVADRLGAFLYPMDALFELGRYAEAEAFLGRAIRATMADHPMLGVTSIATRLHVARGRFQDARDAIARTPHADSSPSHVWHFENAILLARAEGRFDDVRTDVESARAIADEGEVDGPISFVLAAGIGAAADRAVLTRRRRRPTESVDAGNLAAAWFDDLKARTERARADGGAGAYVEAANATAVAEVGRARGESSSGAWSAAERSWINLKHPYQTAYARLRLAEAILDSRGDRGEAEAALRLAYDGADSLGAVPLRDGIEAFAALSGFDVRRASDHDLAAPPVQDPLLTARERAVLSLVAEGHTNREIGARLVISEKTVSVHVSNAMTKLGALSRYEAASSAERLELI